MVVAVRRHGGDGEDDKYDARDVSSPSKAMLSVLMHMVMMVL